MNISKYEGSTEEEGNFPPVKYSAIVRAAQGESKKDFKTPFGCVLKFWLENTVWMHHAWTNPSPCPNRKPKDLNELLCNTVLVFPVEIGVLNISDVQIK